MDYNIDDQEAIMLVRENSNEAKDILLKKYSYIIDILIAKYKRIAYLLKIDQNDLFQEAMLGFTDAINKYEDDKQAGLARFITVCVERKIQNHLKKSNTLKNRMMVESLSLEQTFDNNSNPLIDMIKDKEATNPLVELTNEENLNELIEKINIVLSDFEIEVYTLMINGVNYRDIAILLDKDPKQIDNTIQRIRQKIKKILAK